MGNTHYAGTMPETLSPDYRSLPDSLGQNQQRDPNVERTLLRHGNYDFATRSLRWDPSRPRRLPASLFRDRKPAWFGNCPWPPFDPTRPESATLDNLPAGYRYTHGHDPR